MKKRDEEQRLPIACSLPPPELRLRVLALREKMVNRITKVEDLDDGIAMRLAPLEDTLTEAAAFIDFERQCCGFATFELRRDEADGSLWVEIRGPRGTRAFFEELLPNPDGRQLE